MALLSCILHSSSLSALTLQSDLHFCGASSDELRVKWLADLQSRQCTNTLLQTVLIVSAYTPSCVYLGPMSSPALHPCQLHLRCWRVHWGQGAAVHGRQQLSVPDVLLVARLFQSLSKLTSLKLAAPAAVVFAAIRFW